MARAWARRWPPPLGSLLSAVYASRLAPALQGLPAAEADAARESVVGAAGVPGLHDAAAGAFSAGMSGVLLACAALVVLAAVGCSRRLPRLA